MGCRRSTSCSHGHGPRKNEIPQANLQVRHWTISWIFLNFFVVLSATLKCTLKINLENILAQFGNYEVLQNTDFHLFQRLVQLGRKEKPRNSDLSKEQKFYDAGGRSRLGERPKTVQVINRLSNVTTTYYTTIFYIGFCMHISYIFMHNIR